MESSWRAEEGTMSHTAEPTGRPWLPAAGAPGPVSSRAARGRRRPTPLPWADEHLGTSCSQGCLKQPTEIPRDLGQGDRRGDHRAGGDGPAASRSPRPLHHIAESAPQGQRSRRPAHPRGEPRRRAADGRTHPGGRSRFHSRARAPPPLTEMRPRPAIYGERPPPAARCPLSREEGASPRRSARAARCGGAGAGDALSPGRGRGWAGQSSS